MNVQSVCTASAGSAGVLAVYFKFKAERRTISNTNFNEVHTLRSNKMIRHDKKTASTYHLIIKVKVTLEQAMKAEMGNRGIALLFL
jgi:hypothetical protein